MPESSNPLPPGQKGADAAASLTAAITELGKLAAALDQQGQPGSRPLANVSPREFVDALLDCIFRPIPKGGNTKRGIAGEVCPFTGLKKNALYELFKLRDEAGFPVIDTVSMKEKDEKHGTKLYSPGSVLRHLRERSRQQAKEKEN